MLHVHYSNAQEVLVRQLVNLLEQPLEDPLQPEVVVVQNRGMARWLQQELASLQGMCGNVEFLFPAGLVWRLFGAMRADLGERSAWDRPVLLWRVLELLEDCREVPQFEPLARYLEGDAFGLRRYQLAGRIGDALDQYLVYRPDWLEAWEQGRLVDLGPDEAWQAALWRRLAAGGTGPHRAALYREFLQTPPERIVEHMQLPRRLSVFGVAAMPAVVLDVLAHVADGLDLHLHWLNPSREYWGDIVSPRDLARWERQRGEAAPEFVEEGNALLASLGRLGRDAFFLQRQRLVEPLAVRDAAAEDHLFLEYPPQSLLDHLQQDILTLTNRGADGSEPAQIAADDRSLQIHACHSPMREVEVLHDQLLALFEADRELTPRDVLVMTPNIDAYAPVIEAVFGAPEDPARRMPYTIADRALREESPVVQAFLALLEFDRARFSAPEVLDLLRLAPVRARFAIDEADLPRIEAWLTATGIRWGLDGANRERLGLPAGEHNTWSRGLDRLLLGYALPLEGRALYGDILPYDGLEGSAALLAGRLAEFVDALRRLAQRLQRPCTPARWARLLGEALDQFLAVPGEQEPDLQLLREALAELAGQAELAGFAAEVPLAVVRAHLGQVLGEAEPRGTFLAGQLTFAGMVPMRAIPFKVICLLGMDDGSFPRIRHAPGFDLMARQRRRGDRSLREDDRYLFLESLLSARQVFYISYLGQDLRDNSGKPPSVVVSELLDYLEQGYRGSDQRSWQQRLVTRHPLQPFSPAYFRGESPLFSYSEQHCRVARALGAPAPQRPFCPEPLPAAGEEWQELELQSLLRFYAHPQRYFLRERLGLRLHDGEAELPARECFALEGLERYQLNAGLLEQALAGEAVESQYPLYAAAGDLPPGPLGRLEFAELAESSRRFAGQLREAGVGQGESLEVDLQLAGVRLRGWLEGVGAQGLVDYRPARTKGRDLLALWIRHLLQQLLGRASPSRWFGRDGSYRLEAVAPVQAGEALGDLLALYREGLCRPLPLYPEAAYAYAEALHQGKPADEALAAARRRFEQADYGEAQDPEVLLVHGPDPALEQAFAELAQRVYAPLLAQVRR